MTKGLQVTFRNDGRLRIDTGEVVSGLQACVQNCLVNFLQELGKDLLFPDKGVDLLPRALAGLSSVSESNHAANFAAVDTLFFHRETAVADAADKIDVLRLETRTLGVGSVSLQPTFQSVDGRIVTAEIAYP